MSAYSKNHRLLPPPTDVVGTYGYRLAQERVRQNLSQQELATKANVKRETVCRVESGEHAVTLAVAVSLADALNVPLQALLPVRSVDMPACAAIARLLIDQAEKLLAQAPQNP